MHAWMDGWVGGCLIDGHRLWHEGVEAGEGGEGEG